MNTAFFFIAALVFLTLFSSFIKTLSGTVGLPNVMPALRDPMLALLFFYGVSKLNFYKSRLWPITIACLFLFIISYLGSALFENSIAVGLYYIRIYFLPIAFFIAYLGILNTQSKVSAEHFLVRLIVIFNNSLFFVALTIYILLQATPSLRNTLFGAELLPTAWYISGGTWMRMGLPLSSPNTLGIVFAINAFFLLSLLTANELTSTNSKIKKSSLLTALLLATFGLLLSFSRSSMLLVIFATPFLLTIYGSFTFKKLGKTLFLGFIGLFLITTLAIVVDKLSDGYVERWILLNTSLKDPSMLGHASSIQEALENIDEYIYWGYPKGTVGAKAAMFGGVAKNVENSFLAVVYDMGLFIAIPYALGVLSLLALGFRVAQQAILVASFCIPCFLLPYVFEADALVYFCFMYLSLGFIFSQGQVTPKDRLLPKQKPMAHLQSSSRAVGQ